MSNRPKLPMPVTATADAIQNAFISPNVSDSNCEPANVVDVLAALAENTYRIVEAIMPERGAPDEGVNGPASCLTDAVLDLSYSVSTIAEAINNLAEAIRERN